MSFGLSSKRGLTGAGLSLRLWQAFPLLPALYIFVAAGYPAVVQRRGLFSFLADLGFSLLPRWESLGLSALYRLSRSELAVYFAMVGFALLLGLAGDRLLRGKTARAARVVFAVLLGADLIVRLLPLSFNRAFGIPGAVLGFAGNLACLALVLLDLRAAKGQEGGTKEA